MEPLNPPQGEISFVSDLLLSPFCAFARHAKGKADSATPSHPQFPVPTREGNGWYSVVKAKSRGQMDGGAQRWEGFFYMETLARCGNGFFSPAMQEPVPLGGGKGCFCPQYGQREIWVLAFCLFNVKQKRFALFKEKRSSFCITKGAWQLDCAGPVVSAKKEDAVNRW